MSYAISAFISCPTLQDNLNGYFGCDRTKTLKMNETSLVQFLVSPVNTNGNLQNQIYPGNGKKRSVELIYKPRLSTSEVSDTIDYDNCTATQKWGMLSETYELDETDGVFISRVVDVSDLIAICQDNQDYVNEMIAAMMDAAIRKMDIRLATQVAALRGNFGLDESDVTDDVKSVSTTTQTTGIRDDNFISEIEFAASNAGYCAAPFVFGYHEISKAYIRMKGACCATNGMNLAALEAGTNISFIENRNIPTALGANTHFLTLDPGAVQLLQYVMYEGPKGINVVDDDISKQTVLVHPILGIKFDFRMTRVCNKLHFFISTAFKAVGVPDNVYVADDNFSGVTGVNEYVIDNS